MSSSSRKQNKPPPDTLPLASLLDGLGEVIQIVDAEWNIFYINQTAADLGNKIAQETLGKNVWAEFPELVGSYLEVACRHAMQEQVRIDFEFYFMRCTKWFEIHLHPIPSHLTLYATEITRRVHAEAQVEHLVEIESLNARLQEMNEALTLSNVRQHELTEIADLLNARLQRAMQESHHRIKNNLQVIAALVEMQIDEVGASASDEHLKRINQHVRALANIHDLLTHQAKNDANIEVTLRVEGDQARLEICDEGNGFVAGFNWHNATHTGLSLIDSTARYDLRGEVDYQNHSKGGGRVAITFPIPALTHVSERLTSPDPESKHHETQS